MKSMSPATPEDLAGLLLVARLLVPAKKAPTAASVQKNLAPLFTHRMSAAEWNELFKQALARQIAAGHVIQKPLALTELGRGFALSYWQIERIPPKITWNALCKQHLVPRVLGLPRQSSGKALTQASLVAAVLKSRRGLPAEVALTTTGIVAALAWKQLGIDSTAPFTPQGVVERLLPKSARKRSAAEVVNQLARVELETTGKDLFEGALRQWIMGGPSGTSRETGSGTAAIAADDPRQFSERVRLAAKQCPTGRFGGDKIFISHVWKQFTVPETPSPLPLAEFKDRLVEAHRAGLLELSRADLVERMDPVDVSQSETRYLDARFHFVRLDS
jgi:hypothetical protein